jgi:hypothetical protein
VKKYPFGSVWTVTPVGNNAPGPDRPAHVAADSTSIDTSLFGAPSMRPISIARVASMATAPISTGGFVGLAAGTSAMKRPIEVGAAPTATVVKFESVAVSTMVTAPGVVRFTMNSREPSGVTDIPLGLGIPDTVDDTVFVPVEMTETEFDSSLAT